jgi:hypothetical protein
MDGRNVYAVGSREIGLRLALGESEFHTTGLRTGSAFSRARIDQLALELGNAGEHRDQH